MSRLDIIPVKYIINGQDFIVNLVVASDENEMILIDCGMKGSYEIIKEEMKKRGLEIEKLTKVIITHQDRDHMGALKEIKEKIKNVEILASEEEAKYISGREEFIRIQNINKVIDKVSDDKKKALLAYKEALNGVDTVEVDKFVKDGDIIKGAGDLEIIETPGHLKGHISVLVKAEKTLVTGDALVVVDGVLVPSNKEYTLDMEEAKESIKKLLNYDIEKLVCYHGGLFTDNVKEKMKEF